MSEVGFLTFWPTEIFFSYEGKRVGKKKKELWTVASLNDRKLKTFILDVQMVCRIFKIVFKYLKAAASPGNSQLDGIIWQENRTKGITVVVH